MQVNEQSFGIKLFFVANFTFRNKYNLKDTGLIKICHYCQDLKIIIQMGFLSIPFYLATSSNNMDHL